jgi:hypothetical protein
VRTLVGALLVLIGAAEPTGADVRVLVAGDVRADDGRALHALRAPRFGDAGRLLFLANSDAIVRGTGDARSVLVATGDALPSPLAGTFRSLSAPVGNGGPFVFTATLNGAGAEDGLFRWRDGALELLTLGSARLRDGSMTPTGDVVYRTRFDVLLWQDDARRLVTIAASVRLATRPALNTDRVVAFVTSGRDGEVFRWRPADGLTPIATGGTSVNGAFIDRIERDVPFVDAQGQVLFAARLRGGTRGERVIMADQAGVLSIRHDLSQLPRLTVDPGVTTETRAAAYEHAGGKVRTLAGPGDVTRAGTVTGIVRAVGGRAWLAILAEVETEGEDGTRYAVLAGRPDAWRPVVRSGDQRPDGQVSYVDAGTAIALSGRSVVFANEYDGPGVFTGRAGGHVRALVTPDHTFRGDTFVRLAAGPDNLAVRGGLVLFTGTTAQGGNGLFAARPGGLRRVLGAGQRAPGLNGATFSSFQGPVASDRRVLLIAWLESACRPFVLEGGRVHPLTPPPPDPPFARCGFSGRLAVSRRVAAAEVYTQTGTAIVSWRRRDRPVTVLTEGDPFPPGGTIDGIVDFDAAGTRVVVAARLSPDAPTGNALVVIDVP